MEFIKSTDWFAIAICVVVVGLLLYVVWSALTVASNRSETRRVRAKKMAEQIRSQIFATGAEFEGRYLPERVQAVLNRAWQDFERIGKDASYVRSEEEVLAIESEVAAIVECIKKEAAVLPTDAELEADRLALQEHLAEFEAAKAKELLDMEAEHRRQIELLNESLVDERESIATALEQIAAMLSKT